MIRVNFGQGEGRGGPVTEWAIDEVCSRMEGGVSREVIDLDYIYGTIV